MSLAPELFYYVVICAEPVDLLALYVPLSNVTRSNKNVFTTVKNAEYMLYQMDLFIQRTARPQHRSLPRNAVVTQEMSDELFQQCKNRKCEP